MWTRGIPDDDAQDWNSCATTTGDGKISNWDRLFSDKWLRICAGWLTSGRRRSFMQANNGLHDCRWRNFTPPAPTITPGHVRRGLRWPRIHYRRFAIAPVAIRFLKTPR